MDNSGASHDVNRTHQGITEYEPAAGCSVAVLFSMVWIGGIILASQAAHWFIEQGMVEGSIRQDPGRWVISLAAGLGIVIPFGLLSRLKNRTYSALFKSWALVGMVILLLTPTRLLPIPNSQGVAALQLLGLTLFCLALYLVTGRSLQSTPFTKESGSWFAILSVLGMGGMLGFGWVTMGALGSWLDVVLGAAVGLLGGAALFLSLSTGILQVPEMRGDSNYFFKGIAISQALVILCGALGINGNEWILLMVVPAVGWLAGLWLRPAGLLRNGFVLFVGAAFSWPLIWVDADELSLIITLGQGELFDWIGAAAVIALVTGLLLTVFTFAAIRFKRRLHFGAKIAGIGLAIIILALGALYVVRGSPGLFGERLFVILKEQVDLSAVPQTLAYEERREAVYELLVSHAEATQADLRTDLQWWGINYKPFYLVNALEVDAGPLARLLLSAHPAVERVLDNPILRPLPQALPEAYQPGEPEKSTLWNLRMIKADHVWDELNVRGAGIIIGQSDSGVQGNHPELAEKYHGLNVGDERNWFDPWFESKSPVDAGGHGTHTLGTILGDTVGVAPEATWIGCVNLARNLGNPGYYLSCMQFMLAPFPQNGNPFKDGEPLAGAHVFNNSWGCPPIEGCDASSLEAAVRALRKAGVFVVVSAGNSGLSGCGSVDSPLAIYDDVYTVGAVDSSGNRADFSSLGPVVVDGSRRIKPDILAPGEGIYSSYPGSGYNTLSGTSMAGPHVVGVVALMWSANPRLIGDVGLTERILSQTATAYVGLKVRCDDEQDDPPSNVSGYGIVDAYAAVRAALALEP